MKTFLLSKKLIWAVIFLSFCINCQSPDDSPKKSKEAIAVLFVGNSLTYSNNMPDMFENLAVSSGHEVYVDQATVSGTALRELVHNQLVISKINEQQWDYIVLQSDDISAFPDMYEIEINTVNTFKNMISQSNPSAQVIYTMIWGLRDGITLQELNGQIVAYSYDDYMHKIYDGTIYIAKAAKVMIAPVGWAWHSVISADDAKKMLLFAADKAHPALHGSYLMACVMNAVIFQDANTAIAFYSGISAGEATYYQQIAVTTVFDSLAPWNNFGDESQR